MTTLRALLANLTVLGPETIAADILEQEVAAITVDSRQVVPGSLFIALRGAKADGRQFIADAVSKGCLAVVVEAGETFAQAAVPVIRVPDSHAAIGQLAAAWYDYPARRLKLIGITGTNGKTTSSWLIESMLIAAGHRPGVIGTVNYRYHDGNALHILCEAPLTTPDPMTLQGLFATMLAAGVTHVIMEVSSHALVQQRLGSTGFDVALFTNLSRDHLDYHRTMEDYCQAKERLFSEHLKPNGRAVVVIGPHAEGVDWGRRMCCVVDGTVIRCGLEPDCEVRAEEVGQTLDGFHCLMVLDGQRVAFSSPLTGSYNVLNVLAAAGVGLALGLPQDLICQGLSRVGRIPGRLERVRLGGEGRNLAGPAVFVDYAHTPDALDNVLTTLKGLPHRRLICVFGCGGDRDRGKRAQMGAIAVRHADVVLITSDNPRTERPESILEEIIHGVEVSGGHLQTLATLFCGPQPKSGYAVVSNRHQAIAAACSLAAPGDSVLIAGKGHEQYQIVGTRKEFFADQQEAMNGLVHWNERHLLAATGGQRMAGSQQTVLQDISTDTRTLRPGDVFVALPGETFDGHAYIDKAVDAGAAAVVAERMPPTFRDGVVYIQVTDSLRALGDLAGYRRRLLGPAITVAAITGSSGKTTVKELVAAIGTEALRDTRTGIDPLLKTQGNFNNLVGLPLSLLPLAAGHRLVVLEMGMSAPGEIARLTAIADPDIGCINNVHPAHLQGLGSLAGVAAAKGELFAGMRPEAIRVVNDDDLQVREQAHTSGGRQIGFAVTTSGRKYNPEVRVTREENLGEQGMRFTLHIGDWQQRLTVPVCGAHNVANCAAAAAIAHAAGIDPATIVRGLVNYAPAVDKRLAISQLPCGLKVVNDAYNANPASMAAGLRTVASFGGQCRHVAALGDMLELGPTAAELHAGIGSLVASLGYDRLLVLGNHALDVARAAQAGGLPADRVLVAGDPQTMADHLCALLARKELAPGDWLFIKGSRGMRMERLLEELNKRQQQNS